MWHVGGLVRLKILVQILLCATMSLSLIACQEGAEDATTGSTGGGGSNGANADPALSSIVGTSPIVANGSAASTIVIALRTSGAAGISGVRPTFTASGAGNTLGTCSVTNSAGLSTCTLRSINAETKTL